MKKILLLSFILLFSFSSTIAQEDNPNYDASLAKKLGADDYGMKKFVLVILKSGSNTSDNKEAKSKAFEGHFSNMTKMQEEGKLIVAGPIAKNDNTYRGIFILDVQSTEEAEELLKDDGAIKAGYLEFDLYSWYGSAALGQYLVDADKIWKKQP